MSLFLGILVGAVLGLTGAGGSILAVPLLMFGLGWTLPQAAPVALLAVCAAASFGTMVAWDVTYIRWRAAILMAIAGWVMAPFGLWTAASMPTAWLSGLFAMVLVLVAVRLLRQALSMPSESGIVRATVSGDDSPSQGNLVHMNEHGRIIWTPVAGSAVASIGAATGFLAGLLGVGGGFVIVPALRFATPLSMHSAVSTSLMAIALTSAGTVVASMLQGQSMPWAIAVPFLLGSLAGMWLGRTLAPRIAGPRLQQGFSVMMLVVAVGLGLRTLGLV